MRRLSLSLRHAYLHKLTQCVSSPPNADYTLHRLLLGTHTSGAAGDHLIIAQVQIPKAVEGNLGEYDDEKGGESREWAMEAGSRG